MQQSLLIKPQSLLLRSPFLFRELYLCNNVSSTALQWKIRKSHLFCGSFNLSYLNLPTLSPLQGKRKPVVAARKNRRRTGWPRSGKAALECAFFIASNLKLLPEPMNLMIKEGFGGGNGGGLGSWNGFGGGGFDGWRGRKRWNLGFLGLLVAICALLLLLILGKEFEGLSNLALGVLGLFLLAILDRDWKRGIKGWILGFFSCALMVFLGLTREDLRRWVPGFRNRSPSIMKFVRRRRRAM